MNGKDVVFITTIQCHTSYYSESFTRDLAGRDWFQVLKIIDIEKLPFLLGRCLHKIKIEGRNTALNCFGHCKGTKLGRGCCTRWSSCVMTKRFMVQIQLGAGPSQYFFEEPLNGSLKEVHYSENAKATWLTCLRVNGLISHRMDNLKV